MRMPEPNDFSETVEDVRRDMARTVQDEADLRALVDTYVKEWLKDPTIVFRWSNQEWKEWGLGYLEHTINPDGSITVNCGYYICEAFDKGSNIGHRNPAYNYFGKWLKWHYPGVAERVGHRACFRGEYFF